MLSPGCDPERRPAPACHQEWAHDAGHRHLGRRYGYCWALLLIEWSRRSHTPCSPRSWRCRVAAACLAAAGMGAWLAVRRGAAVPPSAAVAVSARQPMEPPAAPLEEPAAGTEGVLKRQPGSRCGPRRPPSDRFSSRPAPRPSGTAAQSVGHLGHARRSGPPGCVRGVSGRLTPTPPRAHPIGAPRTAVRPCTQPNRAGDAERRRHREPLRRRSSSRHRRRPERRVVEPAPKAEFRELVVPSTRFIGLRLETAVRSATGASRTRSKPS